MDAIYESDIGNQPVVSIPEPKNIYDNNGKPVLCRRKQLPTFYVKPHRSDFASGPMMPNKEFYKKYQYSTNATRAKLNVLYHLITLTSYAVAVVVIDSEGNPILDEITIKKEPVVTIKKGRAAITRHGNKTRERTIGEIAKATGLVYDTVRRSLKFWEKEKVIYLIDPSNTLMEQKKKYKKNKQADQLKDEDTKLMHFGFGMDNLIFVMVILSIIFPCLFLN